MLHTTCGTPNYVAPEVLQNEGYVGRIADCWSIGVILYVLLAGFLPFDEATMSALFDKIKRAEFAYPAHFSDGVKVLIDSLLVADPQSGRPSRTSKRSVVSGPVAVDCGYRSSSTAADAEEVFLKTSKSTRVQSLTSSSSPTQVVEALRKALTDSGATLAEDQPPKPEETEDETDDEGLGTRSVGSVAAIAVWSVGFGRDGAAFGGWGRAGSAAGQGRHPRLPGVAPGRPGGAVRAEWCFAGGAAGATCLLFYRRRSLGKVVFILNRGDGVAGGCMLPRWGGLHWGLPTTLAGSGVGTFDATRRRRDSPVPSRS